ncbi:MAG TPA: hypothetical protein PK156_27080 [Polyangium sp.]|nr:hypothetical protein [Polyangium sp.]
MMAVQKNHTWMYVLCAASLALSGVACRDRKTSNQNLTNSQALTIADEPLPNLPGGLTIRLTPHPERAQVDVEVHLVGADATPVKELAIAKQWAGIDGFASIRSLRVRDANGEIATRPGPDAGSDRTLSLERPPALEHLEIRYSVASAPLSAPRFALHVDRDGFSGVGQTFLLLPRFDKPIAVHLQIRSNALAPGSSGVTSFGAGEEIDLSAQPWDLAHAVYASGHLRTIERPNAGRLLLLGRPAFDAEMTHRTIMTAHRALETAFGPVQVQEKAKSFTYVLVAEPGLGKGHDGALLGSSFGLWIGNETGLDAPTIIAAAHELAHSWLGGSVRLVDDEGHEQTWFSEGFAVHYARKVSLQEKLISPDDFAADVERTLGIGSSDLGAHPMPRSREAYQRGALYAAQLDAAMDRNSKGKRSLDDVLRKLFARRSSEPSIRVPVAAFRDLVVEELGAGRGEEMTWVMVQSHGEIRLDDDTFGKCFQRTRAKAKTFELGFDRHATLRPPQMIRGLIAGSAAAKAGLAEGGLVLSSKLPDEADRFVDKPVEITVAIRGLTKKVRYLPIGERDDVHWVAKKGCVD